MRSPLLVSIVTYQDAAYLGDCLASVVAQSVPTRIRILDNAPGHGCRKVASHFPVEFKASDRNLGFSEGHNRNLANQDFEWALLLNADVILEGQYLAQILTCLETLPGVGTACGKLLRMDQTGNLTLREGLPVLDSTGIYFTPTLRHFDRGSGQPDSGQFERLEFVFGVTGAALLLSRAFYEDLRKGEEFLDEDFFIYREDADLAWRGQLRGWRSLYVPQARARHARQVTPERRRQLSPLINYHSLKNRYLMRRKNIDWPVRLRCAPFMWARDLGILAYIVLFERNSLATFSFLWKARHRVAEKRKEIQRTRKCSVSWWFAFSPRSRPVVEENSK